MREVIYQADLSSEPIECYHCKAKIIWNGIGLVGAIEDAWDNKGYKIFSPNHTLQCPECHRKIDSILLPKERVKPWDKHPPREASIFVRRHGAVRQRSLDKI